MLKHNRQIFAFYSDVKNIKRQVRIMLSIIFTVKNTVWKQQLFSLTYVYKFMQTRVCSHTETQDSVTKQ